jgi:nucleoside 2-deoxyribosyltransferase
MRRKIFIACPISKYVKDKSMDYNFKSFIQSVYKQCTTFSNEVFLAIKRENYGEAIMPGEVCVPLDYQALVETDCVIAFPEDSMGVAVEIGWASALNKNILIFVDQRFSYSPLITSVDKICPAEVVSIDFNYSLECQNKIKNYISDYLSKLYQVEFAF